MHLKEFGRSLHFELQNTIKFRKVNKLATHSVIYRCGKGYMKTTTDSDCQIEMVNKYVRPKQIRQSLVKFKC